MKKTLSIIAILIISALVAMFWVKIDDAVSKKLHPIEYAELVEKYAEESSVPKDLVYAVIKVESGFKSDAVSRKGAVGLMQITPDTYLWLCEKAGDDKNDPNLLYMPDINIKYGAYYLDMLYSEFGNWESTLAAYNAGPANVRKWLKNSDYSENGILTYIPFEETREYVKKVTEAREEYGALYFNVN